MKPTYKSRNELILGRTSSGKQIYCNPSLNQGFTPGDHLEAYRAHAHHLTFNYLDKPQIAIHRRAMDLHYLAAVVENELQMGR